ncbi:MAG TPA: YjjG family noncanonical pyrimidine nucleotidase [Cyclobacteriaceae bacterium]
MKKDNIKYIFFDLDNTLWDYNSNARETLIELYQRYGFEQKGYFTAGDLVDTFLTVNESLWDEYNHGYVSKKYIREMRFKIIFDRLDLPLEFFPPNIGNDYLIGCPQKSNTLPHAHETLNHLQQKFSLYIITNGFDDIQTIKIKNAGLDKYFKKVFTSESSGHKKPYSGIFDYAFKHSGANHDQSIMVGDNLNTDIKGAIDYGIEAIYFNPLNTPKPDNITDITSLHELVEIL